jgi:translation initiation factor IF-2
VVNSNNNGKKLTLSGSKNTLSLSKDLTKEDILKKLSPINNFITRKGEKAQSNEYNLSSSLSTQEQERRMRALEKQTTVIKDEKLKLKDQETKTKVSLEDAALKELESDTQDFKTQSKEESNKFITSSGMGDVINSSVAIKEKIETNSQNPKKESKTSSFTFKQGESPVAESINLETVETKIDNRDKTLINQMMQHYKYLEFDSDEEIENLQKGLTLRQTLESKRKDSSADQEDIIISSSSAEIDEGVVKIKREAYFNRHNKKFAKKAKVKPSFIQKEVEIYDKNIVLDIARSMAIKVEALIKKLHYYGINVKEEDVVDGDSAELVIEEMGHIVKRVKKLTAEDKLKRKQSSSKLQPITPVVTIMGHVDHGKTSLLDALRNARVAEREQGGITQHIGSYQVELENGNKITFIDTPGHEAFTSIRARGANLTHIIVIVIAADDGIMPQTIEAIKHAKSAGVSIVVAINKIDKPSADVQKIKNSLLAHEIISEDLGGDVICVPISVLKNQNLDKLCDAILLQAEVVSPMAEIDSPASGVVLEGRLNKQKGVISNVLVQNGTLKVGDIVLIGSSYSKVRLLVNDRGESIKYAEPSTPVDIYGLPDVPFPGQNFNVIATEKLAKEISEHRKDKKSEEKENLKEKFLNFLGPKKETNQFNIVIKADAQSTIEAIKYGISKIKIPSEIELNIMQANVGDLTEADVKMAQLNNAIIFTFSVKSSSKDLEFIRKNNITIKEHSVIYNIIDDLKELISAQLKPIVKDEIIGEVEVREIFSIFKIGKIAGCMIKKGLVRRNSIVKIFRGNEEIGEGKLKTLKHFKENVKELSQGKECGIQIENFESFKPNDILQIIDRTEEKRTL